MKLPIILVLISVLLGCSNSFSRSEDNSAGDMKLLSRLIAENKPIYLEGLVFKEELDLHKLGTLSKLSTRTSVSNLKLPIYFKNCTFKKGIRSYSDEGESIVISFFEGLQFENCTFNGDLDFSGAHFRLPVYWHNNIFKGEVKLNGATFEHLFSFTENNVYGNWNSNLITFRGPVNFYKSAFNEISVFQEAQFNGSANFTKCKFMHNTDFTMIRAREDIFFTFGFFGGRTWFNSSEWSGLTEFHQTTFEAEVNFDRIRSSREPDFRNTKFSLEPSFDNFLVTLTKPYYYFQN